ncbi:MAG TPA: hypothetical protein PL196_06665 [Burkholderiaceae bacterium]|nr:hypothetical protein [Burkholderiaceae bacterium]
MTDGLAGFGFAPPPFKPAEALMQLQRTLRGIGGLTERGAAFEWKGRPAITLAAGESAIEVRLARRAATRPEWEARTLKNGADVRRFADDVKQRIARWRDADE